MTSVSIEAEGRIDRIGVPTIPGPAWVNRTGSFDLIDKALRGYRRDEGHVAMLFIDLERSGR